MRFWTSIGVILVLSAVGLTYEIAAGRVLAPFFGTSLLTWTAVIATVLAGFSVGSVIGGLVAERDRQTAFRSVRLALVATAALSALTPKLLGLLYASGARGTEGMFLSVVVAFFPASVLVTTPTPFLAKLAVEARPGHEGFSLGVVLAAGSVGAIFGAILAGFVTLPLFGSVATFAGCGAVALLCALLMREKPPGSGRSAPAKGDGTLSPDDGFVPMFAAAGLVVLASMTGGQACRYESGISCIDLQRRGGAVYLYSDRTQQAAERTDRDGDALKGTERLVLDYTRWLWARMDHDLDRAPSVLFIGGGGYSLPTLLLESRPEAEAVAVEIDPLVTQVVRTHMPWAGALINETGYNLDLDSSEERPDGRRLGILHADGRVYLNEADQRFDAAVIDAFSSGSVPAHLATYEVYERLRDIVKGPVYVNLIDAPDGSLARGVHAILQGLYSEVVAVQGTVNSQGRANILLVASEEPLSSVEGAPNDFQRVVITPSRAFTDDRGWVGHR